MVVGDIVTETEVLVLGAGVAGRAAAVRAAALGLDVTLVERATPGGWGLVAGLVPLALFREAALALHWVREATPLGDLALPPDLAWLAARREALVRRLAAEGRDALSAHGVHVVSGDARLSGPTEAHVDTAEGTKSFRFRFALVATGSRPAIPAGFPEDGSFLTPEAALALPERPERLVVVGGGATGVAIAAGYRLLGSSVTLLEAEERLLPGFDRDLARAVAAGLARLGVDVRTGATALGPAAATEGVAVAYATRDGEAAVHGTHAVLATGRRAELPPGLAEIGVAADGFLAVDERLVTARPTVLAAGDVTGPPFSAARARRQGAVAAEVMAGRPAAFEPVAVPRVAFAVPEVAQVGWGDPEVAAAGDAVTVVAAPLAAVVGGGEGFVRLVLEKGSGALLGAAACGRGAAEVIAEMALALEMGALAEDVAATLHVEPGVAEAWARAAATATT